MDSYDQWMSNKLILILERFTSNALELLWNTSIYLTIINAILRPITQLWCYFIAIRVKWIAKFFKAATEDDKFHHGFWPKQNCRRNLPGRYGNIYKVHHPILVLEYFWVFGQASIHPSTHSDCWSCRLVYHLQWHPNMDRWTFDWDWRLSSFGN